MALWLAGVVGTGGCGGGAGVDPRTMVDPVALIGLANVLDSCSLASPSVYVNDTTDTLHKGMGDGCAYTGKGTCSLRDGVFFGNVRTWTCGTARNTHISLPANTYALMQATDRALLVEGELFVDGAGPKTTIIEGGPNAASDASLALGLSVGIDSVFRVAKTGNLSVDGVTIRYGNSPTTGGGIEAFGYLTLHNCVIADNRAVGSGGGITGGAGSTVELVDTVVSGNVAGGEGGGIAAVDSILRGSAVQSNRAARGGGVASTYLVQLFDTAVSGNHALILGGGIYNDRFARTRGFNVTIDGNSSAGHGGGVANASNGQVEFTMSTISANSALKGNGGGVYNVYNGYELLGPSTGSYVTLIDSSVVANVAMPDENFANGAGGGVCNTDDDFHPLGITYPRPWASVSLRNSVVARNRALSAAGILNQGAESRVWLVGSEVNDNVADFYVGGVVNGGILDVRESTVSGNTAKDGAGGILNVQTATLLNATISANSTTRSGVGGILNTFAASPGRLTLTFSTVASNSTGIATWPGAGPFTVKQSIVANSTAGANCPLGAVTSEGHNLDSGSSCGFTKVEDIQGADPRLGPLTVNAPGVRATHALLPGSPAVDAGGDSADGCPPTDARGVSRPRGNECDIGAYELEN